MGNRWTPMHWPIRKKNEKKYFYLYFQLDPQIKFRFFFFRWHGSKFPGQRSSAGDPSSANVWPEPAARFAHISRRFLPLPRLLVVDHRPETVARETVGHGKPAEVPASPLPPFCVLGTHGAYALSHAQRFGASLPVQRRHGCHEATARQPGSAEPQVARGLHARWSRICIHQWRKLAHKESESASLYALLCSFCYEFCRIGVL